MPSAWEILPDHTNECPGQTSHPINYEEVHNFLISKTALQKDYFDCRHNAHPMPKLY